ncbi:hypothetical protein, partial [Amorphus sp. 3PC139-8]|uniref:hypothetical protein n=1 Tax=Amorphus sp. 3PC139-8 TaxID=2735676 RepID=UPI00345DE14F
PFVLGRLRPNAPCAANSEWRLCAALEAKFSIFSSLKYVYQNPSLMISTRRLYLASIIAIMFASGMPAYAEEGFTSADFLKQPEESRSSYIRVSLMMANMIAIENDQEQADCIEGWYDSDRSGTERFIYGVMEKYPSYHPIGIIMAVIEKQCGSFKYAAN